MLSIFLLLLSPMVGGAASLALVVFGGTAVSLCPWSSVIQYQWNLFPFIYISHWVCTLLILSQRKKIICWLFENICLGDRDWRDIFGTYAQSLCLVDTWSVSYYHPKILLHWDGNDYFMYLLSSFSQYNLEFSNGK